VFAALQAGAAGYLLKDSDPDDLLRAIRQVQRGESSLHPAVARKLLSEMSQPRPSAEPDPLTEREKEVLAYLAQGVEQSGNCRKTGGQQSHRAFARQPHSGKAAVGQPHSGRPVCRSKGVYYPAKAGKALSVMR